MLKANTIIHKELSTAHKKYYVGVLEHTNNEGKKLWIRQSFSPRGDRGTALRDAMMMKFQLVELSELIHKVGLEVDETNE